MRDFSASPYPPTDSHAPPGRAHRRGALKWAAVACAILCALLLGLLTLSLIGYETGAVALLAGMVIAVLPAPLYVTLVLWLDRYEPEPPWMLAVAFFWGALVAVFFAIIVNSAGVLVVEQLFDRAFASFYGMVISAPVVEESAKALALFALYAWRPEEFDDVLDGIIYAAMVGLGFAMTENVKYYGEAVAHGGAVGAFVVRGMFSPYAHPLFTSMTGIGIGLASQSANRTARRVAPLAGFALAMLLHGAWNASVYFSTRLDNGWVALVFYFLVMVPIFAGVLLTVWLALARERRILREHLRHEVECGRLSPAEYDCLCSMRGRMGASLRALARGGLRGWSVCRRFNAITSELAFHRQRLARGAAADASREADFVRLIAELRARGGLNL